MATVLAGAQRLALVIGNNAYKSDSLRNPVNDARSMARALAETGFGVTVTEDATQIGMKRAIRRFGDDLAKAGWDFSSTPGTACR